MLTTSHSEDEEQEAWINALLGRIFWDFLGEKYWSTLVSKKIQMKLSKIKVGIFSYVSTICLGSPFLKGTVIEFQSAGSAGCYQATCQGLHQSVFFLNHKVAWHVYHNC